MRFFLCGAAFVALAACEPSIPDSGAGVGFGDYSEYIELEAVRDAELTGQGLPPAQGVTSAPLSGTSTDAGADVAADARAVLDATRANSGEAPLQASASNPPPEVINDPSGISRENDFSAVDAERTIEDDAQLRRQQQAQYRVIPPTALPSRSGASGPNIVRYALSTSHPKGQSQYRRGGLNAQARYERNCAKYPSPDLAQLEFLEKGGPQRDRLGLDPDGDGYACDWDPAPFRKVRGN
ncbi:hypothetical protein [Aquicoccus porphyridii]|uniref:hypothetical protein n=1 Tax=Aquicoccus porphyridii TaxID=1852029 RepID=UPI00273D2A90|nr:hypothetical protein [Aquicoccus porphyridii]